MREKKTSTDENKLKNLMSLYDESEQAIKSPRLDLAPIFSGLIPTITEFTEEELIAKGGMKLVYRVFDPKTARYIALARLRSDSPQELYEPFLREARLTALLDHPNIITILDIGLDADKTPWFTMELKTGKNLSQTINEIYQQSGDYLKTETLTNLLNIFLKVCDAIDYAHNRNVIHLDLKPDNIQVGKHGEVIVCDWGLGKLIGHADYDGGDFDRLLLNPDLLNNMTLTGQIKGSPGFMAPEQISKKSEQTSKTDIYALGAILYQILTNHIPVDGKDPDEIMDNTLAGKFVNPQKRHSGANIPSSLIAVALKALEVSPEKRYQSVNELRSDILKYLHGFSTLAEKANILLELKLLYLRQKKIINISVLSLILLSVAAGISFISIRKSEMAAVAAYKQLELEKEERIRLGREAAPQYYERALNALRNGSLDWSLENFKVASLLDREFIDAHNHYACLLFMKGKYAEADKAFYPNPQSHYRSIYKFNQAHLSGNLTKEQEFQMTQELLKGCSDVIQTPLTTAFFLHWAQDEREEYRKLAMNYLVVTKEMCKGMLHFLQKSNHPATLESILLKIHQVLSESPDWIHRRTPATLGAEISPNERLKEKFRNLIPLNLALGQPLENLGGYRSNPEYAVDGIISDYNYWSASPLPAQIEIDLGDFPRISRIVVHLNDFFSEEKKPYMYTLVGKFSDNLFRELARSDDLTHVKSLTHVYEFDEMPISILRLKINFNENKTPIKIKEIEVY